MENVTVATGEVKKIRVSFEFGGYNFRRYGKPWGAVVTFNGAKPQYDFGAGSYLGDDSGGRVVVICRPNDIVACGQRDFRKAQKTENDWYVVEADGTSRSVSRAEAYDLWCATQEGGK
jgi:hypothetical protein